MISSMLYIREPDLSSFVGELFLYGNSKKSYSSTFSNNEKIHITVKIPRQLGILAVKLLVYNENCRNTVFSMEASWKNFEGASDIYTLSFDSQKLGIGLFFCDIELKSIFGTLYAVKNGNALFFDKKLADKKLQITVSDFKYSKPSEIYGGIMYHIFVDRFSKSKANLATDTVPWGAPIPEYPEYPGAPLKNTYLYGGDLWGIAEKLHYLKSLGVTVIYLSPIFESPSNHKYDTADYMKVDFSFGGDEALVNLIAKCKKVGISIILDGVFNHTGADSRYFNMFNSYEDTGAYNSKTSKYYEWYDFKSYPSEYTSWWGIKILPRINPDIPSLRSFISGKNGVIDKYMKLGVSGFRLDVVDELSDDFVESIKNRLNTQNKHSYLIGEVWEDASNKIAYGKRKRYFLGSELDGVMNYPLRTAIIEFLKNNNDSIMAQALTDIIFNAPKRIRDAQMNVIGTHDTARILTVLGGKSPEGMTNSQLSEERMSSEEYALGKKRLLMAYTFIATVPGIPSIYYGDEAGMEGYSDPFNRRTYPWGAVDADINNHYIKIGKIRKNHDIYKEGEFKLLYIKNGLLVFSRYDEEHSYLTILNNTFGDIELTFSSKAISLFNDKKSASFKISSLSSEIIKAPKNAFFEIIKHK